MFQASHLARPLKSNIPGRSVDVQRQGEGFFLCFNASQKYCIVVALPTSGEKQAFNVCLIRSTASSIRHMKTEYFTHALIWATAPPVRPHFF